jgi:anaerobic magnesium-protoporphyrin IX monomethyl ester cyclase
MNVAFVFMNDTPIVGRGAGYMAGVIAAAGYPVSFFDTFYTPVEQIVNQIVAGPADIIMISTMTMNFPLALALIRKIKKSRNLPVLVGGIHPTIEGARLLEQHPEIDYLCVGEGESMVIDFLRLFSSPALFDIQNLCYRKNRKVYCNPLRPAEDLSTLPAFPWHFFRKESIGDGGRGFLYVTASRGCPFNCTYCCNGIYLKYYGKNYIRFRPIDKIIEELECLKKVHSPRLFYFGDEMILADPEYAKRLFAEVKCRIGIPYGLMARVEYVTPELTEHLKRTGCQYVAMGIECGDENFRKKHLNRNHSNEQIERAFTLLKDAGIFRSSFNIIGYPFDCDDSLTKKTINLNKRVKPDYAYFTILYPFPGTKLYNRCIELNLIDNDRIEKTRQYYEESVLKNVFLKKKCARISRRFNSVIPFETLFDFKTSEEGPLLVSFKKMKYRSMYWLKHMLKLLLGKKVIARIRSRLIS